jgi:DNA-binding Lrp family transcriptional regulator
MVMAFLTINTIPDKIENVLRDIKEIQGIKQAHMVYGNFDVIAELKAKNIEELRNMILKIRKMPNVLLTLIQMVVN